MTAVSGPLRVNEPFPFCPKGGGRSRSPIAQPAPENRAPRSPMTGALHRERCSWRGLGEAGLVGIRALLCSIGSGVSHTFGRRLHDCQLSGVGGALDGR